MTKNTTHLIYYTCFYFLLVAHEKEKQDTLEKLMYFNLVPSVPKFSFI